MNTFHRHPLKPLMAMLVIAIGWSFYTALAVGDESVSMSACRSDPSLCKFFPVRMEKPANIRQ